MGPSEPGGTDPGRDDADGDVRRAHGEDVFADGLFGVPEARGLWHQVIASGVALLISIVAVMWYLARGRSRRPVS